MKHARELATFTAYDDFIAALRARADELQMSRETIDAIAGLTDRYTAKLLGPGQVRRIGMTSLGPLLTALGVRLVLIEDAEATKRIGASQGTRVEAQVRHRARRAPLAIIEATA